MIINFMSSLHLRWTILTASGFTTAPLTSLIGRRIFILSLLRNYCLCFLTLRLIFRMTRRHAFRFSSAYFLYFKSSSSRFCKLTGKSAGGSNSILNYSIFKFIILMSSYNFWLLCPKVRTNLMSYRCWFCIFITLNLLYVLIKNLFLNVKDITSWSN